MTSRDRPELQAPAYLGGDRRLKVPSTEPSLGPFWDTAITVSALFLGVVGLAFCFQSYGDSGQIPLGWAALSAGYFFGGLLNGYLSTLWQRDDLGWRAEIAVAVLKPLVMLFLLAAIALALLFMLLIAFWLADKDTL